jgi:hypothetical protein
MRVLTLPFRALWWVLEEVAAQAERAYHDEDALRHALGELYLLLDDGRVTEEEFRVREAELACRLTEAQAYRRRTQGA